jgi:hypothetical protein
VIMSFYSRGTLRWKDWMINRYSPARYDI